MPSSPGRSSFSLNAEVTRRLSALLPFVVLRMVAFAAWVETAIGCVFGKASSEFRRLSERLRTFHVTLIAELLLLACFGIVAFAILGVVVSGRPIVGITAAIVALWVICVVIAIYTSVKMVSDKHTHDYDDESKQLL